MKNPDNRSWLRLTLLCLGLTLLLSFVLSPIFTYNRRDNFEYFTPTITEAHQQWYKGVLPLWNPHQHLGEPLLGNSQPGVFYLPYTLCTYIVQKANLPIDSLTLIITLLHLIWAAVGWFFLLRLFRVRPFVSLITTVIVSKNRTQNKREKEC